MKGRDHSEDLGVDGGKTEMDLVETGLEHADWTQLAQDTDR
jgi:hypothetical protein